MSEERIAALESQLRTVTDNVGRLVDQVAKKGFIPAFQCGHSGLYYPGDYVKEWGRLYGIGLGPHPVSECLDSDYSAPLPAITPEIRRIEDIMHPLVTTCAQVDLVVIHPDEYKAGALILAKDDPVLERRASLVRAKQLENPRSRLRNLVAAWKEGK